MKVTSWMKIVDAIGVFLEILGLGMSFVTIICALIFLSAIF